jgi:PAS domain S-box-containing protein
LQIKQQANLLRQIETYEKEREILELKQESYLSYAHLADAVPHSIVKVNSSGHIEYFNQQWLEYTGIKSEVAWKSLVYPKDRRKFSAFWLHMYHQSKQAYEIEIRLRSAQDGIYRWHLVRAVPDIKNGRNICWIVSCTDIDKIKSTEEEFKTLSQKLNRSNKELEEYAYVASHDLKEPLHVVSSFVYLLEKRFQSKLDDHERQYLRFIKEGVGQAQRLIKDLLEYSCVGKEKVYVLVGISSVLTEVTANLKTIIDEAGAMIECDEMPEITANYLEMVQLFQNLIVNAIKYRSQRPLKIKIAVRPEGEFYVFSIKDNGIGIDSQYKERIFDMFQRLHAKNEYSGTGIGLAICKKIVENHGGRIWVDSILGEGTMVYFTIKQNIVTHRF